MAETENTTSSPTQQLLIRLQRVYNLKQEEIEAETSIPQTRVSRWTRGMVPAGVDDVFKLQALEEKCKRKASKATPAPAGP